MTRSEPMLRLFTGGPRFDRFYELFTQAGANVEETTARLAKLMREWPDDGARLRFELKELETRGDEITHDVIQHLNLKSPTPVSAADAHELISEVDDIVDLAEEVGDFMGLYRIEAATTQAIALAEVLERAGHELAVALTRLGRPADLRPHIAVLYDLEHEGDRLERDALSSLFDEGIDPMVVVRWKDIYERLEDAIDAAHHAGNTLEGLLVKDA